jgi:hypothetical protein
MLLAIDHEWTAWADYGSTASTSGASKFIDAA